MDEDPFWDIELDRQNQESSSIDWLAPNLNDEIGKSHNYEKEQFVYKSSSSNEGSPLNVTITETMGDGVMGIIGGELWEAALLLCSYIIVDRDLQKKAIESNVCELGSGVGLSGLMVLALKQQAKSGCKVGELCLSDYEKCLLDNLALSVQRQTEQANRASNKDVTVSDSEIGIGIGNGKSRVNCERTVCVEKVDWYDYFPLPASSSSHDRTDNNNSVHVTSTGGSSNLLVDKQRFDLAIGSALCYSPDHATALLSTVRHLLVGAEGEWGEEEPCACKEVLVIQIKDRPGFQRFLRFLEESPDLLHSIQTLPEEVYTHAQTISSTASVPLGHFLATESASATVGSNGLNGLNGGGLLDELEDGEISCEKTYIIPRMTHGEGEDGGGGGESEKPSYNNEPSKYHKPSKDNLIKTDRESFVILKIRARDA